MTGDLWPMIECAPAIISTILAASLILNISPRNWAHALVIVALGYSAASMIGEAAMVLSKATQSQTLELATFGLTIFTTSAWAARRRSISWPAVGLSAWILAEIAAASTLGRPASLVDYWSQGVHYYLALAAAASVAARLAWRSETVIR